VVEAEDAEAGEDAAEEEDVEVAGADMTHLSQDRVGLSWRTELAAGIFAHREQIDVVEVIAEDWFDASRSKVSALRTLATQIPVQLHGTSAGLASAAPVADKRLAKMARLVEMVQPEAWSEHLAFVRAGGWEIGHLAAVPRNAITVENSALNVARAERIVGMMPMVENIATLISPPASSMTEAEWLGRVATAADALLLLDLHNLYVNAMNFADDPATAPMAALRQIPLDRVGTVHIAGGHWVSGGRNRSEQRLLDDHLHPVPDAVFSMLEELAALAPQPLTVVLERDGAYPPMRDLLLELQLARAAMRRGRARQSETVTERTNPINRARSGGSSARLEALLALIYVDEPARTNFLAAPEEFARRHCQNAEEAAALATMDQTGLAMAARSFARKRQLKRVQQY
jgi:uncharacterized protein